jgi:hypothetical protein
VKENPPAQRRKQLYGVGWLAGWLVTGVQLTDFFHIALTV